MAIQKQRQSDIGNVGRAGHHSDRAGPGGISNTDERKQVAMTTQAMDLARIPVDQLHFDPLNPRLPKSVDGSDDQAVLEWMLQDAGLVELMGSIAVKGYFPAEPLLVMPAQERDGYLVLEGNRRLAAVLLLLEPTRAPRRKNAVIQMTEQSVDREALRELPCAVFKQREEVLDYLGYRHITGIKQWEPAAKARYLESLYEEHFPDAGEAVYRKIARIIGSRADYVMRLLGALKLYETVLSAGHDELTEDGVSFSLLTLALNYTNIVDYLGLESLTQQSFGDLDPDRVRDLAGWMYVDRPSLGRTQLGESRNMKLLAAAVGHEGGVEALRRGETVEEAARATVDISDLLLRSLRVARDRILGAQALLHRADVSAEVLNLLEELEDLLAQISVLARRKARRREGDDVQ